jgi:hypothetical protein
LTLFRFGLAAHEKVYGKIKENGAGQRDINLRQHYSPPPNILSRQRRVSKFQFQKATLSGITDTKNSVKK